MNFKVSQDERLGFCFPFIHSVPKSPKAEANPVGGGKSEGGEEAVGEPISARSGSV